MPGFRHGRLRAKALHHRADALRLGDLAQPGDARYAASAIISPESPRRALRRQPRSGATRRLRRWPCRAEPIDNAVLDNLAQLQREGRPDIVNRVITLFLESAPALLKDLQDGAGKADTAQLHRASHTLKSASANVGAALLSRALPRARSDGAHRRGARRGGAGRNDHRGLPARASRVNSPPAAGCVMSDPFQRVGPLILIADDDETERFLQRQVLEPAGFEIVEAKNGSAALEAFNEHRPDLVILDVMMPEMSGFEVCQAIRTLPGGRNTPVLMATALDDVALDRASLSGRRHRFYRQADQLAGAAAPGALSAARA